MRKAIKLLIFSILIVFVFYQGRPKSNPDITVYKNTDQLVEATKKLNTEISVDDFKKLHQGEDHVVHLDIRSVGEYDAAYIPGTVNLESRVLEFKISKEEIWDELGLYIPEKTDKTIMYCRTGCRSAIATKALMQPGFENTMSLQGGYKSWNKTNPHMTEKIAVEETTQEIKIPEAPLESKPARSA